MKIIKKKLIHYKGKVNDLSVKNSHTYNVEDLAVHNSAGGSMVAYLTDITTIDPIPQGLMFERFYNEGRNSPGNISLPDIDSDFPVERREDVKKQIVERWGQDRVGNITTFGTLKGKNALKEVLRIKQRCSFTEMNKITSFIPDEGKISDKLKEMEEQEGESSIIKWALENSNSFNEWVKIKDGKLEGAFSLDFGQAIELEGCIKSHGTHAGGVVIGKYPLVEICPLLRDGDKYKIAYDMGDAEKIGLVKMDILGVKAIDDVMLTCSLINGEEC